MVFVGRHNGKKSFFCFPFYRFEFTLLIFCWLKNKRNNIDKTTLSSYLNNNNNNRGLRKERYDHTPNEHGYDSRPLEVDLLSDNNKPVGNYLKHSYHENGDNRLKRKEKDSKFSHRECCRGGKQELFKGWFEQDFKKKTSRGSRNNGYHYYNEDYLTF